MTIRLRTIGPDEHLAFMDSLPSASHMQMPSWGGVKTDWRAESLGWFDEADRIVGAALVLYRPLPKVKRYLAYLPEGPVIDWFDADLDRWLQPLLAHLKAQGAFTVKMGPPVIARRWDAATVKDAIADPQAHRLGEVEPTTQDPRAFALIEQLRGTGWQQSGGGSEDGFAAGQPRYVFQLSLANRSVEEIQRGLNQLWRRNVRKAEKAGVKVVQGGYDDLATFYGLYAETAARDQFMPRPLEYFQRMWNALTAEDPDRMRLYLAEHDGEVLAAATMLTVGRHVWYSYGASANHKREVRPSNAMQWRMLRDAYAMGASVYDLRGISDSLDETDHLFGLIQFKVGTGGQAAEYLGEWDFPLNKLLHKALDIYMSRR